MPPHVCPLTGQQRHVMSLTVRYPYFHWPTFWLQVQQGLYRSDRAFSAAVMAACAMASSRIRDGAFDRFPNPPVFPIETAVSLSEEFYRAAIRAIPVDLSVATEFNYKRAKALLCAVAIQFGYARTFSAHLGDYMTMCSIDGFHHENRWPAGLNAIDIQERRRLVSVLHITSASPNGAVLADVPDGCILCHHLEWSDPTSRISKYSSLPRRSRRRRYYRAWHFADYTIKPSLDEGLDLCCRPLSYP